MLCNYVPYVYNRSELKWQKKEQKLFLQLLAESRSHYESLVELPIMVGQPLSGKITLDAVISEYARKAKTQGILFDMLVKPLAQTQIAELDLAVIADYLLQQAFSNVKNGEDAFVQLNISDKCGSVIISVAYVGNHIKKRSGDAALSDAVIKKYGGTKMRRKRERETQYSVLLPKTNLVSEPNA